MMVTFRFEYRMGWSVYEILYKIEQSMQLNTIKSEGQHFKASTYLFTIREICWVTNSKGQSLFYNRHDVIWLVCSYQPITTQC